MLLKKIELKEKILVVLIVLYVIKINVIILVKVLAIKICIKNV